MTTRIEKFYPWKHPCPKCALRDRTRLLYEHEDRLNYCARCVLIWRLPMTDGETEEAKQNARELRELDRGRVTRTLDEIVGPAPHMNEYPPITHNVFDGVEESRGPWTREQTTAALGNSDDGPPITEADREQDARNPYTQMRQAAHRYAEAMIRHATVWLTMRDAPLHENGKLYDTLYQYADEMDRLHKELKHLTREIAERSMT